MTAHRIMRKNQSGFSLVELMVAALIGLIGTIVIFQVFAVFESQKRSATSGGDAQSNLALAMHAIERDARQSGFGINDPTLFGCAVTAWDETPPGGGAAAALTGLNFVPVSIVQGSTTPDASGSTPQADTLTFFYGSSDLAHFPPKLTKTMTSATEAYQVSNRHGFEVGDVLIAAELISGVQRCSLSQVTGLPAASSANVEHDGSGRFNKSGGVGAANYAFEATRIFNLGKTPVQNTYTVSNGQLLVKNFGALAMPMMDGIAQMQARYGKDTNGDGIVDAYNETAPTTAAEWAQVLTLRVALVARVSQYEKTLVSPATLTLWNGGPVWTLGTEDQHYRYRVLDTIIPIRNMFWKRTTS
jgi:type IV pilus assembly protein PilW